MIKIAICDDDIKLLKHMEQLVTEFISSSVDSYQCKYKAFNNGNDFLEEIEQGEHYNIVLLDILMPSINGIQLASELRKSNDDSKIIFITSTPEYAIDSYEVKAFHYLLKPVSKNALFQVMNNAIKEIYDIENKQIIIKCKKHISKVYLHNIVFVEIIERTLNFHLKNGGVLTSQGPLNELEQQLLVHPEFIKPHRSYIVNMDHIELLGAKEIITVDGSKIPIPHKQHTEIMKKYINYSVK